MNDPTPLPDVLRDELLSAELDDEFDAAAHDLGLDPEVARARLAITPGVAARRDAMREARDALQTPIEMDELLGARLRAKATSEASSVRDDLQARRARRMYSALGAVAAAFVLIVGVAFALNRSTTHSQNSKVSVASPNRQGGESAPTASQTSHPPTKVLAGAGALANTFDYGASPSVDALASAVRSQITATRKATSLAGSSSDYAQEGSVARDAALTPLSTCSAAAAQAAGTTTPAVQGVATVDGQPVLVYAYEKGGSAIIVVLTPDCRLLRDVVTPHS